MMDQIAALALPAAQAVLAVALFLVAGLCLRLDRRIQDLKSGRDGIAQSSAELAVLVARAEAAVGALKTATAEAADTLDSRTAQAKAMADGLTFALTAAKALEPRAREAAPVPARREARLDDDGYPLARRTPPGGERWGGLR